MTPLDIVHLPAVFLLAVVMLCGLAFVTVVPAANEITRTAPDRWPLAYGLIIAVVAANYLVWHIYIRTLKADPQSRFLGKRRTVWLILMAVGYLMGLSMGGYILVLSWTA